MDNLKKGILHVSDIIESAYTCFFFSLAASVEGVLSPITFWFRTLHILHKKAAYI